jgi:hypothetical protein
MRKVVEETQYVTQKKRIVICDDCGKTIKHDLACSVATCEICGADLCEKCIGLEVPTMGDYREVYCFGCHWLIKDNNKEILELRQKADDLEENLFNACKEERNKKTKAKLSENPQPK